MSGQEAGKDKWVCPNAITFYLPRFLILTFHQL